MASVSRSRTTPTGSLYASNGARPDVAHYDVSVKRIGKFRWKWEVVHWPETYNGRNGRQYPDLDWRDGGTTITREAARRSAEAAIRRHGQDEEWDDSTEHWSVPS